MIIDLAKAVPIEDEIARRSIKLAGRGAERCGPCPRCGTGTDRFSINVKKQVFNCRGCSTGGDVIALVQHLDGCDFRTAVQTLACTERSVITTIKPVVKNMALDENENTDRALALWEDASPVDGVPLAESYLRRRGLLNDLLDEQVLRYLGRCPFGDTIHPCLLALYRDIHTNQPKAITRTALGPNGTKVGRLSLGPVGGAAVKIDDDTNVEIGLAIGEGLETCLAARQLGFKPTWSLGSSGAIRSFPVLAGIESLTILVDHDQPDRAGRQAGQQASIECSQRWTAEEREVRRVLPRRPGADMADVVEGGRHAARREG
jgi:hypothetical protein